MNNKNKGVTLIELMLAVAIVGILAAIAYPSYSRYVLSSHRTEAQAALTRIANLEERYFMDTNSYGTLQDLHLTATSAAIYTTDNGYYQVSITPSSATYTLTATATGNQVGDTDCQTFTLTQDGLKTSSSAAASICWH